MNSYSKVFKASHLSLVEEVKVISQKLIPIGMKNNELHSENQQEMVNAASHQQADMINENAKSEAKVILEKAEHDARLIEAEAKRNIEQWWQENQEKLTTEKALAKQRGYEEGYEQGMREARLAVQQDYEYKLDQIQTMLQMAYKEKEAIISEAEPFLLQLSTVIASQIIKQELEANPDQMVNLIQQHILRFKEKESITVCVHPDDFEFIQGQRTHLIAVVNGETEIKIIPDHSVSPKGCIIRTAYGSVDAQIDTQIEEIKKVLLEAGREPESGFIS